MSFTFIDLFAGIGGFHLALHQLNGECVYASEWDSFARKTYEANFKHISPSLFDKNLFRGDIKLEKNQECIPCDVDILCAGFPCQPFSQAGLKKGFDDSRGTLFFEIAKIIKEKQPKSFLLENVRHLLKHDNGKTFDVIYNILTKELRAPFDLLKDYGNSIMTSKNFNRIESKWVEALVQIIGESPIDLERFITEDPSLFEKGQFRALGGINGLQRSPKVLLVLEELRTAPMLGKLQEAFKRKHV